MKCPLKMKPFLIQDSFINKDISSDIKLDINSKHENTSYSSKAISLLSDLFERFDARERNLWMNGVDALNYSIGEGDQIMYNSDPGRIDNATEHIHLGKLLSIRKQWNNNLR